MEWLESEWRHGGADELHQRLWTNVDIEAGEAVLELEPGGDDWKEKTAKPTTLDVEDLRRDTMLGLKLLGEPYRSYF